MAPLKATKKKKKNVRADNSKGSQGRDGREEGSLNKSKKETRHKNTNAGQQKQQKGRVSARVRLRAEATTAQVFRDTSKA